MNTDVRSVRRALKAIPPDELEIIPGGSEKGQKRCPTRYRILLNGNDPNPDRTVRVMRTVKETDHAHTGTGPCANEAKTVRIRSADRAPNAHLTVFNSIKRTEANTRTREVRSHAKKEKPKPSIVLTEEAVQELKRKHPRLNVEALIPEAAKKCALKYPEGGPMKRPFLEDYFDRCEVDIGAPGLIEGQQRKKEEIEQAHRDRMEADRQRELDEAERYSDECHSHARTAIWPQPEMQKPVTRPEPKREESPDEQVAKLAAKFGELPEVDVHAIGNAYKAECEKDGGPWKNNVFEKRVGKAVDEHLRPTHRL
jgi:hypothetical protein